MKRVLFITTKNPDYIRNVQELRLLQQKADVAVIASNSRHYPVRVFSVWCRLFFTSFRKYEEIFVGFAPQLVIPLFGRRMRRSGAILKEDFFLSLYDTFCCDRRVFFVNGGAAHLLHRLDEKTLAAAEEIICDTKAQADFFAAEFYADKRKLNVLYLEADRSIYHPMKSSRQPLIKEFPNILTLSDSLTPPNSPTAPNISTLPDSSARENSFRPVVLYFGSVLPLQGAELVLEAMRELSEDGICHCVFIGPLPKNKLLCTCENVEQINWLPQEALAKKIAAADLCLAGHFHGKIEKAKRTIPGKAFIYEAMGKPMLLGDNAANREYFTESDSVRFVPMGSAEAIAAGVRDYFHI